MYTKWRGKANRKLPQRMKPPSCGSVMRHEGTRALPDLSSLRGFAQGRLLKRRSTTVSSSFGVVAQAKSRSTSKAADGGVRSTLAGVVWHEGTPFPDLSPFRDPFGFAYGRLLKRSSPVALERAVFAPARSRSKSKAADEGVRSTRVLNFGGRLRAPHRRVRHRCRAGHG
jgi:hypothetical protein